MGLLAPQQGLAALSSIINSACSHDQVRMCSLYRCTISGDITLS